MLAPTEHKGFLAVAAPLAALLAGLLTALSPAAPAWAVPAAPFIHRLEQSDGTSFTARRWGDENGSGWETEAGHTILFDAKQSGWVFAQHDSSGGLRSSGKLVGRENPDNLFAKKIRPGKKQRGSQTRAIPGRQAAAADMSESSAAASAPQAAPQATPPAGGSGNIPVVLVNFNNTTTAYTPEDFTTLLFGSGNWSMKDYYSEVSYGTFTVSPGPAGVIGWVTAANTHNYYGQNNASGYDTWPGDLVYEAVQAADATVDFAPYDQDGDCYVDALAIVHQGTGEEASPRSTDIWSHSWDLNSAYYSGSSHHGTYTTNDICAASASQFVKIKKYVIMPEKQGNDMATMGVFAHEYGHALGLPDLYDTDGSSEGAGNWSLMAGGSWNGLSRSGDRPAHLDPWSRYALNWIAPTRLTSSTPGVNFSPVETGSSFYQLLPGSPQSGAGEYFLVENRQKTGFDAGLPGSGLLVWHIDEQIGSDNDREWYPGCTTCTSHYKVALLQADGLYQLEKNSGGGDGGDPFPGSTSRTTIGALTTPNNSLYSALSSGFSITGISSVAQLLTADITVLDTAITAGPAGLVNTASASFSFASAEGSASFECRLDSGVWEGCSSPAGYSGLTDGPHTFSVRSRDDLGSSDTTPAAANWTVDTAPPETSMSSGPVGLTTSTGASFGFTSADPGATYTCRLDAGSWTPCTTPTAYSNIPVGERAFSVRARDLAGNDDPTPASWIWIITTGDIRLLATGQPASYFTTIAAALSGFPAGSAPTISLQALTYAATIDINRCDEQITLAGGYNADFTAIIGQTSVTGPVSITCGTLLVDTLVIN